MRYVVLAMVAVAIVGVMRAAGQGMVAQAYPRVFASPSGRTGLKVVPDAKGMAAAAIAFTLAADGSERVLWRRPMKNIPGDVLVFDHGEEVYVLTLDTWGAVSGEHAMVVYGSKGDVVQDLRPSALTSPSAGPVAGGPIPVQGEPSWRAGVNVQFVTGDPAMRVELRWPDGRIASVGLPGGPVTPAPRAAP
ncbi:MAG: hypothetical protein WBD40_15055 [Tepidisphaeraceae bacterium]